jgi:hypothetical protein
VHEEGVPVTEKAQELLELRAFDVLAGGLQDTFARLGIPLAFLSLADIQDPLHDLV